MQEEEGEEEEEEDGEEEEEEEGSAWYKVKVVSTCGATLTETPQLGGRSLDDYFSTSAGLF